MKYLSYLLGILLVFVACRNTEQERFDKLEDEVIWETYAANFMCDSSIYNEKVVLKRLKIDTSINEIIYVSYIQKAREFLATRSPLCSYEVYIGIDSYRDTIKYVEKDDNSEGKSIKNNKYSYQKFIKSLKNASSLHPDLQRILKEKNIDVNKSK